MRGSKTKNWQEREASQSLAKKKRSRIWKLKRRQRSFSHLSMSDKWTRSSSQFLFRCSQDSLISLNFPLAFSCPTVPRHSPRLQHPHKPITLTHSGHGCQNGNGCSMCAIIRGMLKSLDSSEGRRKERMSDLVLDHILKKLWIREKWQKLGRAIYPLKSLFNDWDVRFGIPGLSINERKKCRCLAIKKNQVFWYRQDTTYSYLLHYGRLTTYSKVPTNSHVVHTWCKVWCICDPFLQGLTKAYLYLTYFKHTWYLLTLYCTCICKWVKIYNSIIQCYPEAWFWAWFLLRFLPQVISGSDF